MVTLNGKEYSIWCAEETTKTWKNGKTTTNYPGKGFLDSVLSSQDTSMS